MRICAASTGSAQRRCAPTPAASTDAISPRAGSRGNQVSRSDGLDIPAIDNKAIPLRHLVVERPCGRVGLVRLPVDARRAGVARALIDRLDQRPADAAAARCLHGEQVLQVADRREQRDE